MAGQKEEEPKKKKKPYWQAVRSTKKDAGPTIEELAKGAWKALGDLGSILWTGKPMKVSTTTVRGAIRRKHTY